MAHVESICSVPLLEPSSSSDSEDLSEHRLDGLLQCGMLHQYTNGKEKVIDCSKTIPVYVDVLPQELKWLDDSKEEFSVVFVVKFWWLDPKLKLFKSRLLLHKEDENGRAYLQEIEVLVRSLAIDGTLHYEEIPVQSPPKVLVVTKEKYTNLEPPNWEHHFFPEFSFINQQSTEEQIKTKIQQLVWCDETGSFVHFKTKYESVFQESLELDAFPVDRQLCRIKMTAEKPMEEFQFIALNSKRRLGRISDMWARADDFDMPCTVYVRPPDHIMQNPFHVIQRSLVNVILHVQRKPSFFEHSVLLMVSLVTAISLCAFALRLDHPGSRLGYLSTCFLAVLAYRYVINDSLPKKSYMTAADKFITQASFYQTWLCVETTILTFCYSYAAKDTRWAIEQCDLLLGILTVIGWLLFTAFYWNKFKWNIEAWRPTWQEVYQNNQEPYCPVAKCRVCDFSRLANQSVHLDIDKKNICPQCQSKTQTVYFTPLDRKPLVPSLKDRDAGNKVERYLSEFCWSSRRGVPPAPIHLGMLLDPCTRQYTLNRKRLTSCEKRNAWKWIKGCH